MIQKELKEIEKRLKKLEKKAGEDALLRGDFGDVLKEGTDQIIQILNRTLKETRGYKRKKRIKN